MSPSRSRLSRGAALLFALSFFWVGQGPAGEPKDKLPPLPPVFSKEYPESPEDLRAIEQRVQEVLKKVMPAVVGVRIGQAQGSAVIVKNDGTVLTAGHVSGKPGADARLLLPDGTALKAKSLGRNVAIDSGMMKITEEGKGPWPFVEMGKSTDLKRGQWVVAIGHPGGFRANRTPVVRVGRILVANKFLIRTDCTLVGGDSGGPLFDMHGRLIGIHSRIGGSITENVHVPVDTYLETWDRLAASESWGTVLGQQVVVQTPGGKVVLEVEGRLSLDDPKDKKQKESVHRVHTFRMAPGSVYTIDLTSLRFNPKKFDPWLRVENSANEHLAEDDDGGGNNNARLVFRPTKDDEYRLIVTTCDPGQAGGYKLVVRQNDLRQSLVAGKADVLRAVNMPKPAAPALVDKLKKGGLSLYAAATLFDEKGVPTAGKELPFQWQKGAKTVVTDAKGMARLELKSENVKGLLAMVPKGYKAAFELTDSEGNYFPLTLSKDFAKEKVKSAGGKLVLQEEGSITEGDPYDKVRKECRHKVHTVKMQPGFAYTIDLESADFDAFLRLEDMSGKQFAEDDDSAGKLNSRVVFRTTKEGAFRVIVTTCDPAQVGAYRLTVHQAEEKKDDAGDKK